MTRPDWDDLQNVEEWERAAMWRNAIIPRLQRASDELAEAYAACPISVERVIVGRVMGQVAHALREAQSGARTSEAQARALREAR